VQADAFAQTRRPLRLRGSPGWPLAVSCLPPSILQAAAQPTCPSDQLLPLRRRAACSCWELAAEHCGIPAQACAVWTSECGGFEGFLTQGPRHRGNRKAWVWVLDSLTSDLAPLLNNYVILDNLLPCPEPQFLHLSLGLRVLILRG
jgi:hypothetical protein